MMGVARRQVLVQLDDDLVAALDRLADEHGISRSEVLRRAARALLAATEVAEKERRYREGYTKFPEEPELTESLMRVAGDTMEPW